MNNSSTGLKKCLVLGANGFIGSHLVDELVAQGFYIKALDHFSQSAQFNKHDNTEIIKGDIYDDVTMARLLEGVDFVIHSFSATTPFTADADPYSDISLNVLRNIQLFEKSVEAGVKKVVFISSGGAVYGRVAEQNDISELATPSPVSPYGIGKLTTEYYLDYFNRKYGLNYVVYRLSNPYGPRQVTKHNQGVVPAFMRKMLNNEEITVIGDGSSSRDYIYIQDAARMIVKSFEKASQQLYNLGSGRQISVKQIIAELQKVMKVKEPLINYIEEPKTFLKHSNLNVSRFQNEFGLSAETDFETGLQKTLASL